VIDWTPNAIALQIGPLPLYWYGVCYALGLMAVYLVVTRLAARIGQNPEYVGNGMIVIGVAALIGGRLYHVIDQFNNCGPGGPCYSQDLLRIVLPPYTGLGVYGGIITGLIAFAYLARRWRLDLWAWADIAAVGIFVMQAIGRWGNFFNQELYGPPTDLPWGIAIDCAHRVAAYPCDTFPVATTHFAPLFLYESLSGVLGAIVLSWILSKPRPALRRGDLLGIGLIWYAVVRFTLEFLRTGNWRLDGIPTAQLFSIGFAAFGLALIALRHATARPDEIPGPPLPEDGDDGGSEGDAEEGSGVEPLDLGEHVAGSSEPATMPDLPASTTKA
jgi:phosphatidylglycerol:prolipoprotein diacylglycerol transferase